MSNSQELFKRSELSWLEEWQWEHYFQISTGRRTQPTVGLFIIRLVIIEATVKMRDIFAWCFCLYFCMKFHILLNATTFKLVLAATSVIAERPNVLVISFRRPRNYLGVLQEVYLMNISENKLS